MKTMGLIGGTGPESTIEYYRLIVDTYRQRVTDGSYPLVLINSVDLNRLVRLVEAGDFQAMADYLARALHQLSVAGADFGLLTANTPHVVFDDLQERVALPLLSIVETACDAASRLGLKRVGLFGTRFTMQGTFYPEVFSRRQIELVTPDAADQALIHQKYMGELILGRIEADTRRQLLEIADRLKESRGIEALLLGGTELPLILRDEDATGIPFLDTTRIHVERAVDWLLAD